MGPGPLGAPGPRCRIRVATVTTYCQASYLLSGKLSPVMKLATYSQASYLQSGKPSAVLKLATYSQASYLLSGKPSDFMKLATYCQAGYLLSGKPSAVWNLHPTSAYMHPNVSAYFAPNNRRHVNINLLISIIY